MHSPHVRSRNINTQRSRLSRTTMVLISIAEALIAVSDSILDKITQLGPVEITKKGRKYKFINNTFQRIQKEDKHLIINPDELHKGFAALSAYLILKSISPGIVSAHRDLCLMIVGVAQELEKNRWYEEENSSVINYKALKFVYVQESANEALEFAKSVTPMHLQMGYSILFCAKLHFFHTDHHIGTRLEGEHLRLRVENFFGEDALELPVVLTALKSFVHWGNIRGILYKLDVPNMNLKDDLVERFDLFPDADQELKDTIYARPPSGTSKYFLVRKALNTILESPYAKLLPYPENDENSNPEDIYALCLKIQADPVTYHLRAEVKQLAALPINLADLSQKYDKTTKSLLQLVGIIINSHECEAFNFLLQNSKIPRLSEQLIESHKSYYDQINDVHKKIEEYKEKGWTTDDILSRLKNDNESVYCKLSALRAKYPEDPRANF